MDDERATTRSGKRLLLLAVAALASAAAALAIGILLFGDFSATEGRILGTTALLAAYGLVALPAAVLQDQRRLPALAVAVTVLAVAGATLTITAVWTGEPSDVLGKTIGTVNAWLAAAAQTSVLAARSSERDPRLVRLLLVASSVLVVVLAAMFSALVWAEIEHEGYARAFGALVVLDVLLVALQPLLARARPTVTVHHLRVVVAPAETVELSIEAPDLAAAAARVIRTLERDGRRVLRLEFTDRAARR